MHLIDLYSQVGRFSQPINHHSLLQCFHQHSNSKYLQMHEFLSARGLITSCIKSNLSSEVRFCCNTMHENKMTLQNHSNHRSFFFLSLEAFCRTHFQCVFVFSPVCVYVRVCASEYVCCLPCTQQEINWLLISGHSGKEKMAVLLKMCQMLQVVDSGTCQIQVNQQSCLCLCHHDFLLSIFWETYSIYFLFCVCVCDLIT